MREPRNDYGERHARERMVLRTPESPVWPANPLMLGPYLEATTASVQEAVAEVRRMARAERERDRQR